jgi:tRNA uracil 4-sulfurtransferase
MERVLIRYGDLTLKGKNQKQFLQQIKAQLTEKLAGLDAKFEWRHDRAYLVLNGATYEEATERLAKIAGLYSFSRVMKCAVDIDTIAATGIALMNASTKGKPTTFKVETKRADKTFPLTSQEVTKEFSKRILRASPNLIVDVQDPEATLSIEIRDDGAYLFVGQDFGMGGYPAGIAGRGLLMLSGGIDSPVAGYLAMKKGLRIDAIHFESTPLTAIESVQKTIDIAALLAAYQPHNALDLHLVPFEELHTLLLKNVPEAYLVTIMRRMMYRIAAAFRELQKIDVLVNGESLGQVASQTIESMRCITAVSTDLILRPLITYDKNDIIKIAREIGTFAISARPFEDCCTIYVPKCPVIRPLARIAEAIEAKFAWQEPLDRAVRNIKTLPIAANQPIDLIGKGLTVAEALT